MQIVMRHREVSGGIIRRVKLVEVTTIVRFAKLEKQIIHSRQLGDFVVMRREGDILRKRKFELLGVMSGPSCDLLISDLVSGPSRFLCDTPVHAKLYERELVERLRSLKAFIDNNKALSVGARLDL